MPGLTGGKVGTPSAFVKPGAEPNCGILVVIGFGAGFGAVGTAPNATDGLEDCGFIVPFFSRSVLVLHDLFGFIIAQL